MNQTVESKKIPFWKKICYGCGAGGGNVMSTLLASFLLSYYTDTAMIGAAAIGTMFVVCRVLDGVTDFAMGGIVDKTNTKWGKARPWLIIAAPLMCIGIILILSVPQGWSEAMKLVYAYVTYIFLNCIVYTIFGVAHTALLARMTRDFKDRNTTSTVSSILNNAVGLVVGTMITALQLNFGWAVTGVILGVIAGVLILIPGIFCEETVGMDVTEGKPKDTVPMKEQLPAVLKNKYFWIALVLGGLTLFVNVNAIAFQIYYCNLVLGDPMYMTTLMSVGQLPGIIILFFMPYFANKFSKRSFMACGAVVMILGFCIIGMAGANTTLLLADTILRSIGIGPMFAGLYAFCADAADYGEWKFGIRSEGLMGSSQSIGSKIGIGFGSACTAWVLAAVGYDSTALVQSDAVVSAVRFGYGWLGAIISVILLVGVLMMDVEKYLPQIRASLGEKKGPEGM
ncbi:MAG: MFS transporter [Clostridiales bacterium]|nr:MFS transporter [Clostridiales bacterium]